MHHSYRAKWNKFDFAWVINLFGTAVGAGILFYRLPLEWAAFGR